MLRKLNTKRGSFILVEVMIVLAVPNFLRSCKRSQVTQVIEDLRIIDPAIDRHASGGKDIAIWEQENEIK